MKMTEELLKEVKAILKEHSSAMLEFYNGEVYYILKQWKYLDVASAPKVFLCNGVKPTDVHITRGKYLYIQGTEHLTELLNSTYESKRKARARR